MAKSFKGLGGKKEKPSSQLNKKSKRKSKKIGVYSSANQQPDTQPHITKNNDNRKIKGETKEEKRLRERKNLFSQYNKERKRIQGYVSKLENEGYTFKNDPTPKKLTRISPKSVENIKQVGISDIARKGTSKYQKEYTKARNRIVSAVRRAEKSGLIFNENVIPNKPEYITKEIVEQLKSVNVRNIKKRGVWVDEITGEERTYEEFKAYKKELQREARQQTKDKEKPLKPVEEINDIPEPEKYFEETPFEKIDSNHYVDENGVIINVEDLNDLQSPIWEENDDVYTAFSDHIIQEYRSYLDTLPLSFSEPLKQFLDNLLRIYGEDNVAIGLQNVDEDIWEYWVRMNLPSDQVAISYSQRLLDFMPELDEDYAPTVNGVTLTKDVIKNNTDFLTQYEYEDMEYVL